MIVTVVAGVLWKSNKKIYANLEGYKLCFDCWNEWKTLVGQAMFNFALWYSYYDDVYLIDIL